MLRRVDGILVLVDSEVGAKEGREDGFWNREGGKGGVAVEIEERVVVVGRDANGADASFGELETRNRQITMRTENREEQRTLQCRTKLSDRLWAG